MHLKSPDPNADAVIHRGRVFPVRGGVFLIAPDSRSEFEGFAIADDISGDVASELAFLGNWPQNEERSLVGDESALVESLHQTAAERDEALARIAKLEAQTTTWSSGETDFTITGGVGAESEGEGVGEDEPAEADEDTEDTEDDAEAEIAPTLDDLLKLKKGDLEDKAKELGLELAAKATKQDLAEAILNAA